MILYFYIIFLMFSWFRSSKDSMFSIIFKHYSLNFFSTPSLYSAKIWLDIAFLVEITGCLHRISYKNLLVSQIILKHCTHLFLSEIGLRKDILKASSTIFYGSKSFFRLFSLAYSLYLQLFFN